jgi:sigma-B regulation protein RsbU (phosphoserine phosphatase)
MWPVYAALWMRVAVMLAATMGVVGVALGMGVWIVRPVGRLSEAVSALSAGNLNARVTGIRARDEIGQLARAYNGMLERLQGHVDALRRETAARESVERELGVARAIQLSLLPREFPEPPGCRVFAMSSPARQVGGDFFDVFTSEGGLLTVVIADVSGKGVPAALFMAVTRTMIRDLAATRAGSPAAMLMRANERLRQENTEGMFVTVFLAQYDPRTGALRYANAGHPHPYVVDSSGGVRTFGRSTGTVEGVLPDQEFEDREESLAPGEQLLAYTDGVTEARSTSGTFFGAGRLEGLLRAEGGRGPRGLCEATLDAVDAFQGNGRADDVTVMVLERLA